MRATTPAAESSQEPKSRLKVLHVINSLAGSGGAEQGLVREVTHFDSSVESLVVRLFEADDLEETLLGHGIKVISLGLSSSHAAWNWPEAARRVRRIIRCFHPHVIQTTLFIGNLVGQLAAIGTDIPVLSTLTITGDESLHRALQPGANTRKAAVLRKIAGWMGRRSFVSYRALTEDTAETNRISMRLDASRIKVIPRGVPLTRHQPDRARFGVPEGVPLIVNVGRQAKQKGQLLLLRAFVMIRQALPEARLLIAGGEGDATDSLRREIDELQLMDSVQLLGSRSDVPVLLASSDLFMFSSLAEGLGTALVEAMAVDLPVVAFDIPPVREVTKNGSYASLVPAGDSQALAVAALRTLGKRSWGGEGPPTSWVAERFETPQIARQVQTLISSLVGEPLSQLLEKHDS